MKPSTSPAFLRIAAAAAFTLASLFGTSAHAIGVDEVVQKASATAYYKGKNGRARVQMQILDAQNRARSREFTILRMDINDQDNGNQKFFVYFHQPADVAQSVFLAWKNVDKEDDRWLYLPGLDLVKRIAASDARTSFMGSHFFYEDVSGRLPTLDEHVLESDTDPYYVVVSTPRQPDTVEFARYRNWIHKASFLPVKTEFLDAKGNVYRTYEALKVENIQGNPTVTEARMSDTRIGGSTTLRYSGVAYDQGLEEELFTERYLRNPPRRVLR